MRNFILGIIISAGLLGLLVPAVGITTIDPGQLRIVAPDGNETVTTLRLVTEVEGNRFVPLELGQGLALTFEAGVLKLVNTSSLNSFVYLPISVTAPITTYTVPAADFIQGTLMIYKNGMLLARPDDYTVSGQTVTFNSEVIIFTGDILTVTYWRQ